MSTEKSMNKMKQFEQNFDKQKWLSDIAETYLDVSQGLYSIQNEEFDIIYTSQPLLELLGYKNENDLPSSAVLRTGGKGQLLERRKFLLSLPLGAPSEPDIKTLRSKNGTLLTFQTRSKWYPSIDGKGRILVINFEDVTTLQEQAEALARQAETDPLTGILNRLGLEKRLGDNQSLRLEHDWAIFIVDIDWFKSVNDQYSHRTGDDLLQAIAKTLRRQASEDGLVGRLGGEEFLIALPWQTEEKAYAFGNHLRREIRNSIVIFEGHTISCTASVGIARLTKGDALNQTLHVADIALHKAKEAGRNKTIIADQAFIREQRARGGFVTELDLVSGIKNQEFKYYVQPIYNIKDKKNEGFEALIHWRRADGTVWAPESFVGRFSTVLYRPEYFEIHQEMRHEVLQTLTKFPDTYVSWNLEFEQFTSNSFVKTVISTLAELTKIRTHPIVVEISEERFTGRANIEEIIHNLENLRKAGVMIALDGFGGKQSNIRSLLQLPIDIVKLDCSLIKNIEHSHREQAFLNGLAYILKQLEIEIIAEGVETLGQAQALSELNIYRHQGNLYGLPSIPSAISVEEHFQ